MYYSDEVCIWKTLTDLWYYRCNSNRYSDILDNIIDAGNHNFLLATSKLKSKVNGQKSVTNILLSEV